MSDSVNDQPWKLVWRPEQIERFWNWWGSNPALEHLYFSKRYGDSILDQISRHIRLSGTVVDLGAGPGYMVDKLIRRGVDTLAMDLSAESVAVLNRRLEGRPHFCGAYASTIDRVPLDDGAADTVLLIEMVEHLQDDVLTGILGQVRRITKPGGYVAITTPNEEDLSQLEIMCPNCNCVFHTYQHVRSWSAGSLRQVMQSFGFVSMVCRPTLFSLPLLPFRVLHHLRFRLMGRQLPHLLYIGRKQ